MDRRFKGIINLIIFLLILGIIVIVMIVSSNDNPQVCVFEAPTKVVWKHVDAKGPMYSFEPISCLYYHDKIKQNFTIIETSNTTSWCFVPCDREGAVLLKDVI